MGRNPSTCIWEANPRLCNINTTLLSSDGIDKNYNEVKNTKSIFQSHLFDKQMENKNICTIFSRLHTIYKITQSAVIKNRLKE